ncbi:MAG TPA: potassium channel family protein [Candidatus Bathyarchaeia archaeon]|nr:potassium channel family protein [Candidatus Bathyarchaeia archaeon]
MPLPRAIRLVSVQYRRHRFAALFGALLLTLASHSFFESLPVIAKPTEWLLALSLAVVLMNVDARPNPLLVLGAVLAFVRLPASLVQAPGLRFVTQILWGASCLLAAVTTMRVAFRRGRVDSERIFAVLNAYLLTGLIFGITFSLISDVRPGSFNLSSRTPMRFEEGAYLSFVVLTSLGFGEIVPRSGVARGLAIVEAVIGQLYLAVLVARLVSLYSAEEFAKYLEERTSRHRKH